MFRFQEKIRRKVRWKCTGKKQKMTQFNTTQYIQTTIATPYVASYDIRPLNEMGLSCSRTLCTRGYTTARSHPIHVARPNHSSLHCVILSTVFWHFWQWPLIGDAHWSMMTLCVSACTPAAATVVSAHVSQCPGQLLGFELLAFRSLSSILRSSFFRNTAATSWAVVNSLGIS